MRPIVGGRKGPGVGEKGPKRLRPHFGTAMERARYDMGMHARSMGRVLLVTILLAVGLFVWMKSGAQRLGDAGLGGVADTTMGGEVEQAMPSGLKKLTRETVAVEEEPETVERAKKIHGMTGALVPSDRPFDESDPWFHLKFQVVDATGAGIARRTLHLYYSFPVSKEVSAQTSTLPFEIVTDSEGFVDRPFALSSDSIRDINVWLYEPGSTAKAMVQVALQLRGEVDLGKVPLLHPIDRYPGPLVTGTIQSDQGDRIAGVEGSVTVERFNEDLSTWPDWTGTEVRVDMAGNFEVYGPPGAQILRVNFNAPDYHAAESDWLDVPSSGVAVVMSKRVMLKGRLVVPAEGPLVTSYGIWITQEGGAYGVWPKADGTFIAYGTQQALQLKITQPSQGNVLFQQDFFAIPIDEVGLGTVDLTGLVRTIDCTIVNTEGQLAKFLSLTIQAEGMEGMKGMSNQQSTDFDGHLLAAIPMHVEEVMLGVEGKELKRFRLDALVGRVVLDW